MQVIFTTKSKNQNRFTISNVKGHGKIWFNKGVLPTTDKDLIRKLMNHPLYERGDFILETNEELVANYLDGKEADRLTEGLLNKLSIEGVKKLGKLLSAKSEQPTLIKVEAEGKPITNEVQEILDFYTIKDEELEKPKENKTETIESPETSVDMTAKEAVEHIENSTKDSLEGFVTDEEERKTVRSAWDEKMS